jgi:uncharacterized protein
MTAAPTIARFKPPASAIALYEGQVMHARMKPKVHRFNYSVYSLMVDVTRLDDADRVSRLLSIGRFNLLSFHEKDHGPGDGSSLAAHVKQLWHAAGMTLEPTRILLICYPRVLGFTFNPIAVYFGYDMQDQLIGVIYEVRNTFGEMHTYVAPVLAGEFTEAGLRQQRDKLFYVSPFMDMPMTYKFRLKPPAEDCAIRILEHDQSGPILAASFFGTYRALTSASLLGAFFRIPLLPIKIIGGIHFEAFRLWFKGIRFFSRPVPPPPVSFNGQYIPNSSIHESRK